ncbi:conserved hypothetical protein [Echinococcus multilocularis]|uniref:Uncharacterized protein n=1 Tax=Echinococcus multilocularis TaxID=6211 RepID=A0A068Y1P3_ECHMU|nr:conserved hypothetical protein [Echinococcus multilocularis]
MDSVKFIFANIVVSNLIKHGIYYFAHDDIADLYESSIKVEEEFSEPAGSAPPPQPSWFLPYILGLQMSVLYLFVQTLRKHELPSGRIRNVLIALIGSDVLFNLMDVLQFALYSNYGVDLVGLISQRHYGTISYLMDVLQHLSVGLHLFLCADVSNMTPSTLKSVSGLSLILSFIANAFLAPTTFDLPNESYQVGSFTAYRTRGIDMNYAQRLSSLHLLPCIGLTVVLVHQRMQKNPHNEIHEKAPNEKGDEEVCVINMGNFIRRSMICHYVISVLYCLITLGIKTKHEALTRFISQFDTPDNTLRKFGYLQQAANIVCLLACLNLEGAGADTTRMDEFESDSQQPPSYLIDGSENELD